MNALESRKTKRLGIRLLFAAMFAVHLMFVFMFKPDLHGDYPLFQSLDSYFLIQVVFDSLLLAALAKRIVEIEENGMWQLQKSLGIAIQKILLAKFRYLATYLFFVQVLEWLAIGVFSYTLGIFHLRGEGVRLGLNFITQFQMHLSLLLIFLVIEMKTKNPHTTLFFSIVATLTGIFTMLTSRLIAYINPFAWTATLMNLDYIKDGTQFQQVLRPNTPYGLPISLIVFLALIIYVKYSRHFVLEKE